MERFRADGHLTDEALAALARDGDLDELGRLEIAEHLSFCDSCLQRYTDLLAGTELLAPERSCQKALWARVRTRTLRLVTSRYATAAAAVALALTVLWGGQEIRFSRPAPPEARPRLAERLQGWPERWNDALSETLSGVTDFFDGLRPGNNAQGGVHS
nr:hypothetical protein [uncultured Oscillibacter sp.]